MPPIASPVFFNAANPEVRDQMTASHTIALVLHAHLPFVRHPEHPRFLEERWLFEAISETYLPLLRVFERLDADHVHYRLAISFSPTLCQMLQDELLRDRYVEHLDRLIELGAQEVERSAKDSDVNRMARFYYDRAVEDRVLFTERYERDILKAFDFYHKRGRIELLTTAATHAFLPFLSSYPEALQAQIEVAVSTHRSIFGRNPQGFWLPELGWFPGVDEYLRAYNFAYTIVDTHGLAFSEPVPEMGSFAPIRTPAGLSVFSRDFAASREIWDAETGFPADPLYRDFYRDIGYDLPAQAVEAFLEPGGVRTSTGFKYWAITGKGTDKVLYDGDRAAERVASHAEAFLKSRESRAEAVAAVTGDGDGGIALCAYNAELFGHWWFEGPAFLEEVFRRGADREGLTFAAPSDLLSRDTSLQTATPEFSTWGANGYAETWLDASNDWTYRHILRSVDRMIELAERFPDDGGLKERALNQAAREILLSQSSDWAYMMRDRTSPDYARTRVEESIRNFTTIYDSLGGNYISTEWLTNLERRHNLFPDINYRIFRTKK
jgi:1,4-alpha-glucan branching enzyme